MRWTPRRIHALALVLIFLVIALPFVFWWYDSFRSTIPQGPFIARYYTVESGGGGPGDTLTVKPRIPAGVIGSRTSGPNLSGTSFRFPPIGEDLDRTTKIGTVQVNFLFLTATDANVTLSISYPEGTATLVTRVFPGASSGAQSNLLPYMADFENNKSLPTIILQPRWNTYSFTSIFHVYFPELDQGTNPGYSNGAKPRANHIFGWHFAYLATNSNH